jgi:glycosyltransferase involved in cell wall biosynthesis
MKKIISLVLPCHNEEKNIKKIIPEIIGNIPKKYSYEIIFVDDGSTDSTFNIISEKAKINKRIKVVKFYRQFGHQAALLSGISETSGDAIITMDSDFQHPPNLLPKMISYWEKGSDLIKMQKDILFFDEFIDSIFRKIGYIIWKIVSDGILTPGVSEFRLFDKTIKKYITKNKENQIFLRGVVSFIAKNPVIIPYKVGKRKHGTSSYNFWKNKDVFINGLISFSIKPLRLAGLIGFLLGISAFLFLIIDYINAVITGRRIVEGYLTIVCLMLILNGFQIFFMGIMGEYIGIIFKEVKGRPIYFIEKKLNLEK